ncbi:MAG TPA: hypothetical protein VMY35_07270 [Phycisphaerae bacterium]|nr:hypothetical protein [Phycisphaerae bacterium]
MVRRGGVWLAILVLAATGAAAEETPSRPAVTLAILIEPAGAEAEAIRARLATALEADAEFRVLDRDHISKVLREHALSLSGAVRAPVQTGRMLGASYLVYAVPQTGGPRPTLGLLCIEVGSGNVLYEKAVALGLPQDDAAAPAWVPEIVAGLKACIHEAEQSRDRPSATVLSVTNKSESRRLEFLEDSLRGILEDMLEAKGYRVLRRRYAGVLAGETALGVSGLVRPDAAVLAEAADLVVAATLTETPSGDTPFERTPIRLRLTVAPKGGAAADRVIPFTLAGMKDLLPELERIIPSSGAKGPGQDWMLAEQKIEAARLMADLKPLAFIASLEDHRRQVETARRIIYLDPSAKEAYYCLGISLDALIRGDPAGFPWTPQASRQVVDVLKTYLRFPDIAPEKGKWAYRYAMIHLAAKFQQEPWEEHRALMTDCVRWRHSLDPVNPPEICWPKYRFSDWWDAHPAGRLAFLKWMDGLYTEKKYLSLFPYKVAAAYAQLGNLDEAAPYLYDAFVTQAPGEYEFNSITAANRGGWWRQAAERLDPEQRDRVIARIEWQERRWKGGPKIAELYGQAFEDPDAGGEDVWGYYLGGADRFLLGRLECPVITPQPVEGAPGDLLYSFVVRRTAAGLWMQGITADKNLTLALLPAQGRWRPIALPERMQDVAHFIIDAAQVGKEVFFALSYQQGVAIYDVEADSWQFLGMKEGLGSDWVWGLAADGPDVWVTGDGFLSRYTAGKVFLHKDKVPRWTEGLAMVAGDLCFLRYEPTELTILDPAGKKPQRMVTEDDLRRLYPVPEFFRPPSRHYNAGRVGRRRLLARPEGLYVATERGLVLIASDGKPQRLWYPAGFCYWKSLVTWVEGNCPLPPCIVKEVIADDRNPDLVWIVSKRDVSYPRRDQSPVGYIDYYLSQAEDAATFITAFDVKKGAFSAPVRTTAPFLHAQPFGDFLYVTGKEFGRIPKTTWVLDQPAPAGDQPVRVHCPDTPLGRASQALFDQGFDRARKHLLEALGAGIAPDKVKEMLAEIERMQKAGQRAKSEEALRSQADDDKE